MPLKIFLIGLLLAPVMGFAATITANGDYLTQNCHSGKGRVEVYDGGSGYDSGVVTFQYLSGASGVYENACPTAADCQWSSGDSGAVPFDLGSGAYVQLNLASVVTAADIDVAIICGPR